MVHPYITIARNTCIEGLASTIETIDPQSNGVTITREKRGTPDMSPPTRVVYSIRKLVQHEVGHVGGACEALGLRLWTLVPPGALQEAS